MKKMGAVFICAQRYDSHFPSAVPWGGPSHWSLPENGGKRTHQQVSPPIWRADVGRRAAMSPRPGVFGCPSDTHIPASCLAGCDSVMGVPPGQPIWRYTGQLEY